MKIKRKGSNGYVWGIVILVLMFLSYFGSNESTLYNAGYTDVASTAMFGALMNVVVNIFIAGLIPTIIYFANRDFYLRKTKLIYILNCILVIIVSIPIFEMFGESESAGMGVIGSVVFSLAVYNVLKENLKRKNDDGDFDEEQFDNFYNEELETSKKFKCTNCGAIVNNYDKKCPNCSAIFEDEDEIKQQFKCDNCGALVNVDATECPNCGEEFEEEIEEKEELDAIYEKAINEKNNGKLAKAEEYFSKYLECVKIKTKSIKDPIYTFNNCVEFTISAEIGELEENAVDLNYKISNAYMYLAFIEFENQLYDEAIKLLNKSLKYNPCNLPALFEMAEISKVNKELRKYLNLTNKLYDKIYNIYDLAHYYRNLGYYYIEKQEWDLAKAVYLYSLKYENSETVTTEIAYIIQESKDDTLPNKENLTKILRENDIPTFIKKDNLNIIKQLKSKLEDEGKTDSNVGNFLNQLMQNNANM